MAHSTLYTRAAEEINWRKLVVNSVIQEIYLIVFGNYSDQFLEKVIAQPLPEGCKLTCYDRDKDADKFEIFLKDPPYSTDFSLDSPNEYKQALASQKAIGIYGKWENPENALDNYLSIIALIHTLAFDENTIAIVDTLLVKMFSKENWQNIIGQPLVNGQFNIVDHILVDYIAQDNGYYWMKTRGMIHFGKPDISVHDLPDNLAEPYLNILNAIANEMVLLNSIPKNNQEIILLNKPSGIKAIHQGSYDDDDFWGNVHIELGPL